MGIRLFVPLLGPFAYIPGRKHAKRAPSGPTLTDQLAESNARNLHAHATAFAEHVGYSDPERFATEVAHIRSAQRTMWALAGIAAGMLALALIVGPGAILVALIPVVGFPFLLMMAAPGVIAALIACRRTRIFTLACRELDISIPA